MFCPLTNGRRRRRRSLLRLNVRFRRFSQFLIDEMSRQGAKRPVGETSLGQNIPNVLKRDVRGAKGSGMEREAVHSSSPSLAIFLVTETSR